MAEVRKRQNSGLSEAADAVGQVATQVKQEQKLIAGLVANALSDKIGSEWAARLAPFVAAAMALLKVFAPLMVNGFVLAKKWYSTLPLEYVQAAFGLALCFFGGVFQASIAAAEAFKLCGWDKTRHHVLAIYEQVDRVMKHQMDKKEVAQMIKNNPDQLVLKQTKLVLQHVEPAVIQGAIAGLFQAWAGVIASLQSQFAKAVALGNAIAEILQNSSATYIVPLVAGGLGEEHRHWIPYVTNWICRSIAVSIAWFLQRIISAVHAALRGGSIFVTNAIKIAKAHGHLTNFDEDNSYMDEAAAAAVALVGFLFQLKGGFALAFPLNILLFPLTLIEWMLVWFASS